MFIDEIDAIGTKRYDSTSGGEREIQRTMVELLTQLDGFEERGEVKVWGSRFRLERACGSLPMFFFFFFFFFLWHCLLLITKH